MEIKKNVKVDIEKQRGTFLFIGLASVLFIVLLAFEWQTPISKLGELGQLGNFTPEEDMIQVTIAEKVVPPPPIQQPAIPEILNIVDDKKIIENELVMTDQQVDETTIAPIVIPIVDEVDDVIIDFSVIEDKPQFPGGDVALLSFIKNNTKYPVIPKEMEISGRVFVSFVINKDGDVTDVKVINNIDPYLDKEAIRVVKSMPKWMPGKQRGKAVNVSYRLPIKFILL